MCVDVMSELLKHGPARDFMSISSMLGTWLASAAAAASAAVAAAPARQRQRQRPHSTKQNTIQIASVVQVLDGIHSKDTHTMLTKQEQ